MPHTGEIIFWFMFSGRGFVLRSCEQILLRMCSSLRFIYEVLYTFGVTRFCAFLTFPPLKLGLELIFFFILEMIALFLFYLSFSLLILLYTVASELRG